MNLSKRRVLLLKDLRIRNLEVDLMNLGLGREATPIREEMIRRTPGRKQIQNTKDLKGMN